MMFYSDIIHKRQSQEQPKCLLRDDDQVKKATHNRGSLSFEKEKKKCDAYFNVDIRPSEIRIHSKLSVIKLMKAERRMIVSMA